MNDTVVAMRETCPQETATAAPCPVDVCVDIVGGKWKPTILYHLGYGATRFNVLRRLIPRVTARMLALQLRELEVDGIVSRTVASQVPPRVDYALTEEGRTLLPVLAAMAAWGVARTAARQAEAA